MSNPESIRADSAEFRGRPAGFIANLVRALFPRAYDVGEERRLGGSPRSEDAGCPAKAKSYHEWNLGTRSWSGRRRRASGRDSYDRRGKGGQQRNTLLAMIAEAGTAKGIGLVEVVVEVDAVDERPLWIRGVLGSELKDRAQPARAAGTDDQQAETVRIIAVL
jgi:hypothetical protein